LQQVVTVTGVDVKKTGTSKRGPWALRLFDTAGGTKFQTFDVELGEFLQTKIGESVEITYEIEENGDFKNNVIQSIKPATAEQAATAPTQADDPRRSKEELRRTECVKAAATIISGPAWTGGTEPEDLFHLADKIAVYAENGAEAFATAEVTY
jgi:hypothetical protein